ncbi:hypothetical protein Q8A73_013240 [Channa argus]|nr:hypothetical protein Q8A73_013240 [Channa argus]
MASTAQQADRRKSHELEMFKLEIEWQKEKIDKLTKERETIKKSNWHQASPSEGDRKLRRTKRNRGASSHVAASLFRYQDRIVRIDCIRAQLLDSFPPVARDTHLRKPKSQFTDHGFYNLTITPSFGWLREY